MTSNPKAVILLGAPGSGKGTQARNLSASFELCHISTGDMLRDALYRQNHNTQAGEAQQADPRSLVHTVMTKVFRERVSSKMATGQLVSDELVNSIVERRIEDPDCESGFVLDGYPRTLAQAQFLDQLLARTGRWAPLVLNIAVDRELLIKRAAGRLTCSVCGEIYNLYFRPPKRPGICDLDGGALVHRPDDNEETVRQRQAIYEEQTRPLINFYRDREYFHDVNGNAAPETIAEELGRLVNNAPARNPIKTA